jgi:hypothetical protein
MENPLGMVNLELAIQGLWVEDSKFKVCDAYVQQSYIRENHNRINGTLHLKSSC